MAFYLIDSVLFKEWNFASIDKVHRTVIKQGDGNVDKVNNQKVKMHIYIEWEIPGTTPWICGQMAFSISRPNVK